MEELKIRIKQFEDEIFLIQANIKQLLNFGNVPDKNWRDVILWSETLKSRRYFLSVLKELENTINNNYGVDNSASNEQIKAMTKGLSID
jgi:hypothetical protein